MSKSSELAVQVKQLKRCGEMLIGIADSLSQLFSSDEEKHMHQRRLLHLKKCEEFLLLNQEKVIQLKLKQFLPNLV